jgi:hypothetical protein
LSSAPALSSRGTTKTSIQGTADDISSRSSWKAYTKGELSRNIDLDENTSFGVAAPILKSFMQVQLSFLLSISWPGGSEIQKMNVPEFFLSNY